MRETERAATTSTDTRLKEASLSGSVQALEALIEEDGLVLDRVSLTWLDDTPLHIAALRGHLDFARALLSRNPKLAGELDSLRCSPLHLASAKGHVEMVRELLKTNPEVCKARDQDGRIPLHLAVIKGRVEVVRELVQARPDSIHDKMIERGDTVLHLCVKYNRLEVLKMLVGEYFFILQSNGKGKGYDLITTGAVDVDGNTILHLAAAFKQLDTVQFLLGMKNIVKEHYCNMKNKNGFTALDVVELYPPPNIDWKRMEIRDLLLEAGGVPRARGNYLQQQQYPQPYHQEEMIASSSFRHPHDQEPTLARSCCCRVVWQPVVRFISKYFGLDEDWFKEVRGHLIIAATLTATMAFQAGISPPGGVWQDVPKNVTAVVDPGDLVGKSIIGTLSRDVYSGFALCNTVSMGASLTTIFLAISGFPLRNKLFIWLLIITMSTTITFTAYSYLLALEMVAPAVQDLQSAKDSVWTSTSTFTLFWFGVCGIVFLLHLCRILVWLGKTLYRFCSFIARRVNKCLKLSTAAMTSWGTTTTTRRPNENPAAIA